MEECMAAKVSSPVSAQSTTPRRRSTIDDVARRVGVHRTTVSKILNQTKNCWASEATRERVHEAVAKLGYRPSLQARGLSTGCSHIIGLVAPGFLAGPHGTAENLTKAAAKAGYTVTVASHANDSDAEDAVLRHLLDCGVDGLLVYPVDTGEHRELRQLVENGFPVVTIAGAHLLDFECDDISLDFEAIGRLQAQHLLSLGRRRICLASTVPTARVNTFRDDAIRCELARTGAPLPFEIKLKYPDEGEVPDADTLAPQLRAFFEDHAGAFDGFIGFDSTASLAIGILHELGVHVPENIAVVGTGNSILASYSSLPITSVGSAHDIPEGKAFELLMDRIQGREISQFRRFTDSAKLFVRKSTRMDAIKYNGAPVTTGSCLEVVEV